MSTDTMIHADGNKRVILHGGRIYEDTLILNSVLAAREESRSAMHHDEALRTQGEHMRAYLFKLADNAHKRAQTFRVQAAYAETAS